MVRCRVHMIWSWCMLRRRSYLLKITASRMKLRSSLRVTKKASVVINFVWNRICHMRGDAAYSSSIVGVSFRIGDICRPIISTRCDILLRYHTFWSLMTFIYLSTNYFGSSTFGNQLLLCHLLCDWYWRRTYDLRWLWLRSNIVSFLVRLDNLVRTCRAHIIVVSFRRSVIIVYLIIIPVSLSRLRSAIHLHSLPRCCRHCMLWGKLLLHVL